jgi:hypothetical protein
MIKWGEYFQVQIDAGRPISEIKLWRREWERMEIDRVERLLRDKKTPYSE